MVPLEHAGVGELGREVEACLASERGQQCVRLFARDHPLDRLDGKRLEVDAVGHLLVGHDRGRVGVDEHGRDAFLTQRLARLGAGVVELRGLADDDWSRAEDENFLRPFRLRGPADRFHYWASLAGHLDKPIVEVLVVLRPRAALRVVLDAESRQHAVAEAFDRPVVQVPL